MKWLEASSKKSVPHLPLYHYHVQLQIDFPVEGMELEGCTTHSYAQGVIMVQK